MAEIVWKYANNGVLSRDGVKGLSGVDRNRYLVRFGAELVLINVENLTKGDESQVAVYLSQPMDWMTENGPRPLTDSDRTKLLDFLEIAFPILGRHPIFE